MIFQVNDMKKLLAILTVCATICAFGSCSEKEESSVEDNSAVTTSAMESSVVQMETHAYDESIDKTAFVGKWECTKFVKGGEEYPNVNGIPQYALFQYDLLEDGKVNLADSLMEIADPESDIAYSWGVINENEIEITSNDGTATVFTMDNGQLVNKTSDEEVYLDKVDEFQEFDFKAFYEQLTPNYSLVPVETDADGNVIGEGEPIPIE